MIKAEWTNKDTLDLQPTFNQLATDCISRQAAIDAVMEFMPSLTTPDGCGQFDREIFEAQEMFVDIGQALNKLPSEPHWIPCSERLPEARRSVILSTKEWTGEGCYWETTTNHVIWKGYRWNATYWDDEVIAWMPLPEPARR